VPIACSDGEIALAGQLFPAGLSDFPVKYLGLPLTVGRLRKSHLQPLVEHPKLEGFPAEQSWQINTG